MNKFIETHEFASKLKGSASFKADFRRKTFLFSFSSNLFWRVGPSGLEPPTSRLSGVRSNRLSYGPFSWWRWGESNPWPPACKAGALPAELHPHFFQGLLVGFSRYSGELVRRAVPSKLNNAITSVSTACPSESFLNLNWSFESKFFVTLLGSP